ncbi:MAG: fibrobacter succinogenes major paralogous domain-containing protein [Fibromonadaceae bacterium]|jgi:uncharacterized protein (TIGR02145 family)|nr:fibrobacter succinogenes major paralogous domain-containing protein [Fibromonadaceae bacterium]
MVLRFFIFSVAFLISCTSEERDSVCDEKSVNYNGCVGGVLPSSSSEPTQSITYGDPVPYDGEVYETVVIGAQTWMARNLNSNVSNSTCYNNDPALCRIYGRLYEWIAAKSVCPSGWHIPSDDDWTALITTVSGSSSTAGRYLKAKSGWLNNNNGEDKYGFSALPGGGRFNEGDFNSVGISGYWWTKTNNNGIPNALVMYYNEDYVSLRLGNMNDDLLSVRCLKDG